MSKIGTIVFLGVLGAAGYGAWENREKMGDIVGWSGESPAELRSIQAAKEAFSLDVHQPNAAAVRERVLNEPGGVVLDWRAEMLDDRFALVFCDYALEAGGGTFTFHVDSTGRAPVRTVTGDEELERKFELEPRFGIRPGPLR